MPSLRINSAKCVGCGLCAKACPFGALRMENRLAVCDSALCTLCGMCVSSCRPGAITIPRDTADHGAVEHAADIWVFAQQESGAVLPVVFELLGKGQELAGQKGGRLVALLLGSDVAGEAEKLIAAGADQVLLWESTLLEHPMDLPYADAICAAVVELHPEILLVGATAFGRSLAPRIAARLGTGLTADCTGLAIAPETGLLLQTRPAFGGNLMATILTEHRWPQMATVRPGVMRASVPDLARSGTVLRFEPPKADNRIRLLCSGRRRQQASIADAPVIVSAGRGIGSAKNLVLVQRAATLLGGQMGVSRPLVDMGWAEYRHQVGQTGLSVAPELLVACGISGAVQHLAGIGNAKTIIAINANPHAPIFSVAHYKVVGDCVAILKELIAAISKKE